jgi:hypothetical protein
MPYGILESTKGLFYCNPANLCFLVHWGSYQIAASFIDALPPNNLWAAIPHNQKPVESNLHHSRVQEHSMREIDCRVGHT